MKRILQFWFLLGFILITYSQQTIDTILPLQEQYWKNPQCGQVISTNDTLKIFGADYRIGANVHFNGFFNFQQNSEVYIKWKFIPNGWSGFSMGPSVFAPGGVTADIPNNQWLYTHFVIDAATRSFTGNICTGNYDDMGGTVQHQYSYTIDDNRWEKLISSDVVLAFYDNYGGTSTEMQIAEVKLKHVYPVDYSGIIDGQILYDFEDNQIPANFNFSAYASNWQVIDTDGVNSTHSLYAEIPQHEESTLYIDVEHAVKVSFDVKYESETHKYMRFQVDTVQAGMFDAYQNTCWKHFEWQFENQGPHRLMWKVFGTSYDQLSGKIWLDNIQIDTTSVQYTAIPDLHFENALTAYDDIPYDHQVPTAAIDTVTVLNVAGSQIADLTGIQDFVSLIQLNASDNNLSDINLSNLSHLVQLRLELNQLTTIDLSNNPILALLSIWSNQLIDLDLSNNPQLYHLSVYDNYLSQIDFSNNPGLTYIYVQDNLLTSIDVSNLSNLYRLNIMQNQISQLDVTNNPSLAILNISENPINNIDISSNPDLLWFYANSTGLTNVDLTQHTQIRKIGLRDCPDLSYLDIRNGNNNLINEFDTRNSPNLTCIFVDDANWWQQNFSNYIDSSQHFVETQTECDAYLDVEQLSKESVFVYPNPALNYISLNKDIDKYIIYDMLGKTIQTGEVKANDTIDISKIKSGIYLIKVIDKNSNEQTFKFIKL